MSFRRFKEVHKLTAEFEGGWSDHPADNGGKTMYGVTQRVYHAWLRSRGQRIKPVRQITLREAEEIYYNNYWLAAGCDNLNAGVDRMVYDAAVNSGPRRSRQWLRRAIGGPDDQTIHNLYDIRMSFLRGLSDWRYFGRGWTRRVKAMKKAALAEVGTSTERPDTVPEPKPEPKKKTFIDYIIDFFTNLFRR